MLTVQMAITVLCVSMHMTEQAYVMPPADANLHVYALPVGQGDATIIQCPSTYGGGVTIFDMGSSVSEQQSAGITYMTDTQIKAFIGTSPIRYVYLSHADQDHFSFIPKLNIDVTQLIHAYIGCDISNYKGTIVTWLNAVAKAGKLTTFSAPCTTTCAPPVSICGGGSIQMRVMGASLDVYNPKVCGNGDSLVARLEYGHGFSLLLPGDLEDYSKVDYYANGNIASCLRGVYNKPGVLKTLLNAWGTGIRSKFYRLAHHGTYPNANKLFFMQAVQPNYVFSSSMLPGTDGSFGHPSCVLYDELVANRATIPIAIVTGTQQQTDYSCGKGKDRYLEDDNRYGIYTTAVLDSSNVFHNYVIIIDTDGTNSVISYRDL